MASFYAVSCLVVCLSQPPAEAAPDMPEGVYALTCRILEVRGKDLLLHVDFPQSVERAFRVRTTDASRFSLFDRASEPAKPETVLKSIRLEDLKKGQKISVTLYSDGKTLRLVSGVASGPVLGGDHAFQSRITELGGKFKKARSFPEDKRPVRWSIDLTGTKTGDRDLALLGRLPNVEELNLSFTRVTDQGLKHLLALHELTDLNLLGTRVTDKAVETLRQIPRLRSLTVAQTGVTGAGVDALLRAFPSLELCRVASGKKGHFWIREQFRQGKLDKKSLMIGDTLFALAFSPDAAAMRGDLGRVATTYYHRKGPVGQVMSRFDWFPSPEGKNTHAADAHLPGSLVGLCAGARLLPDTALVGLWSEPAIGVIRLNGGTHACYGRPLQFFDFYDSTPAIQAFSARQPGQPREFHFVHDALQRGCRVRILNGDERPTLARKGPKRFYSALFVESTREDLRDINTSLMTQEGMADLMGSLRDKGLLCYHISHRYHNLLPPLVDAAKKLGYAWKLARDEGERPHRIVDEDAIYHFSSEWLVVARKAAYLDSLRTHGSVRWSVPEATGRHLWRDG